MQTVDAVQFRGQRLALSERLATDEVMGGVTICLRADDGGKRMVAFDNLEDASEAKGPINGTCDWVERVIVLNTSDTAQTLNFGFYLRGGGTGVCAVEGCQ